MNPATLQTRELAERDSDGIHVLLLWHPRKNTLTVSVEDARVGDQSRHRRRAGSRARCLLPPLRLRRLSGHEPP